MKKYITLQRALVAALFLSLAVSCGDDETVTSVLITSDRATGTIYSINVKTGELTERFTPMYNGAGLNDIRGIVYHPKQKQFYVSANSYADLGNGIQKGWLFKLDPKTDEGTLINDNDGKVNPGDATQSYEIWDAIVNWAVAADDSLVAVGDFNADGNGFVKFGTDGARGKLTAVADVCCGLGMIYDPATKKALLGNGENQDNGALDFETFDTTTGVSEGVVSITTFNGFPTDFTNEYLTSWYTIKGLATKGGSSPIYALMYDVDNGGETYFITVDLNAKTATYITTLGSSSAKQYNALAFVPSNTL